jgi:hypothetical protein
VVQGRPQGEVKTSAFLRFSERLGTVPATTAALPPVSAPTVRSSNLRISKTFTDRDKDAFGEAAFEHIASVFDGSLAELKARNPGIDTTFRRIDANHFSAAIYRDGKAVARCRIWLGGTFGSSGSRHILYSGNDNGADNSGNEMLSVDDDKQAMYLRSMGMQSFRGDESEQKMTEQGAAEYYRALFIEPLQR